MGKSAMLGSLEDTLAMSRAIDGVEPCLDFAHLHARQGDGSMNSYDEWARTLERYGKGLGEEALQRLHIHISGIEYGEKGEKEHLPIQESDLDLAAILRALHDFGCRGRLLCESPIMEEDALYCKQAWLEISGEGETVSGPD
jgi:deoxyribonuclease-4